MPSSLGVKERKSMVDIRMQTGMGGRIEWQMIRLDDGHDVSDRGAITKEGRAHARVLPSNQRSELSQKGEASQVIRARGEVDQDGRSGR